MGILRIFATYINMQYRERLLHFLCMNFNCVEDVVKQGNYIHVITSSNDVPIEFKLLSSETNVEDMKLELFCQRMLR